ncbi:50S ribosomal protein L3 [Halobacteriovorax sp. GB3]|uniref:50S ribosomal protein L3 n=1 Tax=Halobacteriovorax sp. GB3 TaxID=2719615 RepID=UPI00236072E1|nr:50S ribosomal protein L3 [Halobacteriovorax sp. GB3]MDD0854508.1 50S ribosomal protein L3 [Halobacteriovorax sp. GB3]
MAEETKAVEATAAENTATSNTIDLPAIYGVKAGMTRIFDEQGNHVPVTVIKLIPNVVTQVKTTAKDGYEAYQIGFNEKRETLVKKPVQGHLKKANVELNATSFAEVQAASIDEANLGKVVGLGEFTESSFVDVTGTSKGKGFQGTMKRYNFAGGPATHGSHFHRSPGSIGNRATPGKVWKNKKMPGQMGNKKKTIQNIEVVEINADKGYMLLKGSVPGSKNGFVRIAKAIKK